MIAVGFSAGGGNIMQVIARQYGTQTTPDKIYPNYVCDEVDHESADLQVVVPVYGFFTDGMDFSQNPNLPAVFGVVGQKDFLSEMILACVPQGTKTFPDFSFYLAPDAPPRLWSGHRHQGLRQRFYAGSTVARYGHQLHREPPGSAGKDH